MDAVLNNEVLAAVVGRATGAADVALRRAECVPLVDNPENMTTASLRRYCGETEDGTSWSVIAKTLRPASKSPIWERIPDEFRPIVLNDLNWRDEPRIYGCGLSDDLPAGFRLPAVWRIDESETAITIWMEDVADHPRWDRARYARSASALGRLAGRWPEGRATGELGVTRRNMHNLFFGKIVNFDLKTLAEERFWNSSPIAELSDRDLRTDLFTLADRMPSLLDLALTLPHALAHGDAAPANLLEPGDNDIVAIDWSYGSSAPVGSDLGQVLAGRYDSGEADPDELLVLIPAIVDAYCEGVAAEGADVERAAVEAAFAIHMAVRTVFSLLVVERQDDMDPTQLARLINCRAALARAGLGLCSRIAV